MTKIAVLTSGGVDSSVALRLLVEQGGYEIEAFYLKIWLEDDMAFMGRCPWQEDLAIVRHICGEHDVPLNIVSLQREYFATVVAFTIEELRAGRTPSPDVMCNQQIKFRAFVDRISPDFQYVASGHYARREQQNDLSFLLRAADPVKDQTYFLCQLDQRQVRRCLFPLGGLKKSEVRELASSYGLVNADRPDSQGICFLGRIPYDDFVRFHLGERRGDIVDVGSGRTLGEHSGFWFHTIGQRRGLGLSGGPWYVVGKDVQRNIVHVVHGDHLQSRSQRRFVVETPNWISGAPSRKDLEVKLRHGPALIPARIRLTSRGAAEVELSEDDSGIAPGQFAVFYDNEVCLGGGAIA